MFKKVIFFLIISIAIVSCGKKGCPKNNEGDKCNYLFKKS